MDMPSRNQYLKTLIEKQGYLLKSKKDKSRLLDEFCRNTGLNKKYVIRKIRSGQYLISGQKQQRLKRGSVYKNETIKELTRLWKIFDCACGQRLEPLLKNEVDRLVKMREINCSPETIGQLKNISSSTIDRKLKPVKIEEGLKNRYQKKLHPLLYQQIPVRVFIEQDREVLGNIQVDLVEHCGQSALGPFISTLSTTDIYSGWWEGRAVVGRGQEAVSGSLNYLRSGIYPFVWQGLHSDNDTAFINNVLYRYCRNEAIFFSRSRPYKKNDNCLVEEKNKTHIRQVVGYRRYDTLTELEILNELWGKTADFKNFFQPSIKLIKKERVKGHIKRFYDKPKTPYQRVMDYEKLSEDKKRELHDRYNSLNPIELKREIRKLINSLYETYLKKQEKPRGRSVRFLNDVTSTVLVR